MLGEQKAAGEAPGEQTEQLMIEIKEENVEIESQGFGLRDPLPDHDTAMSPSASP